MPQPGATPPVQASQTIFNEDRLQVTEQRRQWVKRAFLHAYEGYKKRELAPVGLDGHIAKCHYCLARCFRSRRNYTFKPPNQGQVRSDIAHIPFCLR